MGCLVIFAIRGADPKDRCNQQENELIHKNILPTGTTIVVYTRVSEHDEKNLQLRYNRPQQLIQGVLWPNRLCKHQS